MKERDRQTAATQETPEGRPPLFSTWKSMYIFVLALHALVIALLYFFTRNYQ